MGGARHKGAGGGVENGAQQEIKSAATLGQQSEDKQELEDGGVAARQPLLSASEMSPPGSPSAVRASEVQKGGFLSILQAFSVLGWTAFGGPTAHIGRFHKSFVETRGWMSEETFSELLALCQTVPGPASTQMSFAIGIFQKGVLGGVLSGVLFQYPGLLIMSLAGFGAAEFLVHPPAWLRGCTAGLAAVAVSLVAEAALLLGTKLCTDVVTLTLAMTSAVVTFYYQSQWIYPTLIVTGGLVTTLTEKKKAVAPSKQSNIDNLGCSITGGGVVLAIWVVLLVTAVVLGNSVPYESARWLHWFKSFYLTGSVTYGGGQVVLPILEHSVVQYACKPGTANQTCIPVESPTTWVTEQQFLAGLALAQALPGPLFNFAAYLGAVMGGFPGVLACWFGLFGPGILIIYGVLPFWGRFRQWPLYKRAMPGLNSSAVGLIFASVFSMGLTAYKTSPFPTATVCIGMIGFWATSFVKVPAPLAILGGGVLGIVGWAASCY